jgi:hypothetical protein
MFDAPLMRLTSALLAGSYEVPVCEADGMRVSRAPLAAMSLALLHLPRRMND